MSVPVVGECQEVVDTLEDICPRLSGPDGYSLLYKALPSVVGGQLRSTALIEGCQMLVDLIQSRAESSQRRPKLAELGEKGREAIP